MPFEIDWDSTTDGWVAFLGPKEKGDKLAVVYTKHFQGLVRNGMMIYEAMDRSSWTIHLTSPQMKVELLEAVLAALPKHA